MAAVQLLGDLLHILSAHLEVSGGKIGHLVLCAAGARNDAVATTKTPVEHQLDRLLGVLFCQRDNQRVIDDLVYRQLLAKTAKRAVRNWNNSLV